MSRLIAHGDQEAISELRLGSVVIDRAGDIWQVLGVRDAILPTRGWFRIGNTTVHGAAIVADHGPLRVLYDRTHDLPDNVTYCAACAGQCIDIDEGGPCLTCNGAGWFNTDTHQPIALAEAIDRVHELRLSAGQEPLLSPFALQIGMDVQAEPKPARRGSQPTVRGRVVDVMIDPADAHRGYVDLEAIVDGKLEKWRAKIVEYSFRPFDDATAVVCGSVTA